MMCQPKKKEQGKGTVLLCQPKMKKTRHFALWWQPKETRKKEKENGASILVFYPKKDEEKGKGMLVSHPKKDEEKGKGMLASHPEKGEAISIFPSQSNEKVRQTHFPKFLIMGNKHHDL